MAREYLWVKTVWGAKRNWGEVGISPPEKLTGEMEAGGRGRCYAPNLKLFISTVSVQGPAAYISPLWPTGSPSQDLCVLV